MNKFYYFLLLKNALTHLFYKTSFTFLLLMGVSFHGISQQPSGFQDNVFKSGLDQVNGITFDASGRAYIWEKGGKVKCRTLDGIWHEILDISEEVNTATDSGLKGFALHPNFLTNGFIYLLYDVDRHHLMNFGTANYNPNASEFLNATIGRITRYTVNISNFTSIVANSRLVLLGTSPSDGIPFIFDTHNVGSLVFGTDGTLLVSCGESSTVNADSGSGEFSFFQQALNDGILKSDDPNTPTVNENENVGSWRTQMVNCLSGKILRIDPLTGNGISSNPFYDASQPRAAKSRVWAMGFRNPFRMTIKPNTGDHLPAAGNPGVIYVGEVGSFRREEINVVITGGQNFGWPKFEGMDESELTGPVVGFPYGRDEFRLAFNHTRPVVDYRSSHAHAYVQGQIREIGTTASNAIPGIDFVGGCSIGGVFYEGTNFPVEYQGRYLHGNFNNGEDPAKNWIHGFTMGSNDELTQSHSFLTNALGVTGMAINPVNGYLYYASYGGSIREVKYDTGNQPPVAKATQNIKFGTSPLTVQFDASLSTDPENGALTYLWNFGDGSPTSTSMNPSHVFTAPNANPIRYDVTLTVRDNTNQTSSISLIVSVNNTPPVINSTTIDNMNLYTNTSNVTVNLQANVTDIQTPTAQLAFKWESSLYHDVHFHANPVDTQQSSSFTMSPLPCDNEVYYYQVKLTVTDAQGLSTVKTKNIVPDCGQVYVDTETPSTPTNLQLTNVNASRISFSWTPSADNVEVAMYEIFRNGVKIGESLTPTYTATGLQPLTFYLFKVTAKDAAGNTSNQSDGLGVYTNAPVTADEFIYGDALGTNWQNFSTISSLNISNSNTQFINTRSIKVTNPTATETLDLRYNGFPFEVSDFPDGLEFWVYNEGSSSYPFQIQAFATTSSGGGLNLGVSAEPHKWTHFVFDWSILNVTQVGKIVLTLNQTQNESLYFDEIKLLYCSNMYSIQTGNWNQGSTWSCGRTPISTDVITVSAGHTVTVLNGTSATLNLLQLLGTLNVQTGAIFKINNY
jgi:glucose/arabinose dehydrogenase/PKD repeat protein